MTEAIVLMARGFEEIEAIATIDVLRRGGIVTEALSIEETKNVVGAHDVQIVADKLLSEYEFTGYEKILIVPGGGLSHQRIKEHERTPELLEMFREDGKYIAAICAGPTVLGHHGLLDGMKATVYPDMEDGLGGAEHVDDLVVVDDWLITGKGPDAAVPFALAIIRTLRDDDTADEVARDIVRM